MPSDPQQKLDALKRGMCGDCGVGPLKGSRRGDGVHLSRRVVWGCVVALSAGVVGLVLMWVAFR